mmetsp:Transcript_89322/g.238819  ORF Transcript_89322/g.238819 Transcript_89322/m.238819 type:complete len:147 (+) Transcript_89322:1200-1640(+)
MSALACLALEHDASGRIVTADDNVIWICQALTKVSSEQLRRADRELTSEVSDGGASASGPPGHVGLAERVTLWPSVAARSAYMDAARILNVSANLKAQCRAFQAARSLQFRDDDDDTLRADSDSAAWRPLERRPWRHVGVYEPPGT